jgi:hypothetical protein
MLRHAPCNSQLLAHAAAASRHTGKNINKIKYIQLIYRITLMNNVRRRDVA